VNRQMTNDYLMYGFWEKVDEIDTRIEQELEDEIRTVKQPVYEPVVKERPQLLKHYHTPYKPSKAFNPSLHTPVKNKL